MDNSWQVGLDEHRFLLDPWLVGSEVDGFSWFNEQWHATPPVPLEQVGRCDAVLVSQPYSDHCHAETLRRMGPGAPVWAVAAARKRLARELPDLQVLEIPDATESWANICGCSVAKLSPAHRIDPIYHALVIARQGNAVFYAPHGFSLRPEQLRAVAHLRIMVLITTLTHFVLPKILGGLINPGTEGARELAEQLRPERILNTHDERKHAKGLVMRLAKVRYPDLDRTGLPEFCRLDDYTPLEW
jgi:hypothetical protein